ncbi:MAG: NAD(P)-dependent alcohol dehydrogenase [Chromatiales bacterium]|nr:NAD(P)-dependent alcohol dehydrogenase [Chromatiales bacterium]
MDRRSFIAASAASALGIARGWFLADKPPELIPLSEGVGTVMAVGEGVDGIAAGDRVTCAHFAAWTDGAWSPAYYRVDVGSTIDGWLADHVILPASGVVVLPPEVSDETAATLSGSGLTAWHALFHAARCSPGYAVLTLGTGGASSWGLQLARTAGASVVVTSSSDSKLEQARALGATHSVNYRSEPAWGEAVQRLAGGVDIVLENVGRETLDQSMLACRPNATLVMIGTAPLPEQLPRMPGLYEKNLTLKAISNGSVRMLGELAQACARNRLSAVIDREFDFREAPAAFAHLLEGAPFGKVLIRH